VCEGGGGVKVKYRASRQDSSANTSPQFCAGDLLDR
jgi:hypothetical protein